MTMQHARLEFDFTALPTDHAGRVIISRRMVEDNAELLELVRRTENAWMVDVYNDFIWLKPGSAPLELGIISYRVKQ